jgi:hypothetical protein
MLLGPTVTTGLADELRSGLTPFIRDMHDILRRSRNELFVIGAGVTEFILAALEQLAPPPPGVDEVFVVNLGFLEFMAGGSFAFLVLIFLKLHWLTGLVSIANARLQAIQQTLVQIHNTLQQMQTAIVNVLVAIQNCVCNLLVRLIAEIRAGLKVEGVLKYEGTFTITIVQVGPGGGGGLLDQIDLLKLLGLLLMLAGFVALLGLAFRTFNASALLGAAAIAAFVASMMPLLELLSKLDWGQIFRIAAGLAALAGFVWLLGKAFQALDPAIKDLLGPLGEFINVLKSLGEALAKLTLAEIGKMALGLGALSLFVLALGKALSSVSAEALAAAPALGEFIAALQSLALALAKLSAGDVAALVVSLAALSGFVYVLGQALASVSADALAAAPALGEFIRALQSLAVALAGLSAADVAGMIVGLAALSGFVYVLGLALSQFSADVLNAIPNLSEFLVRLQELATSLAALGAADIAGMAVALAALAAFVYGLAVALNEFSLQSLLALPALAAFIGVLGNLGLALANLGAADLIGMGVGLALLAGFVYLLAAGLNTLSDSAVMALPHMAQLIANLNLLSMTLSNMGVGELFALGIGLALLVAFVAALGFVATMAAPGLRALAAALGAIQGILSEIVDLAGQAASALKGLGGTILSPVRLPAFQSGGMVPSTGPALVHEGEMVVPAGRTRSFLEREGQQLSGAGAGPVQQTVDQGIHIGGVNITVQAERVDERSVPALGDAIVEQLERRLQDITRQRQFRMGVRQNAVAQGA